VSLDEIRALLPGLTPGERETLVQVLRRDLGVRIHPIEDAWNIPGEAILQAIFEAPDLTQRGVRGVLAEACFRTIVVPTQLTAWRSIPFDGDRAYDLILEDQLGQVTVQVKNQRRERGVPMQMRSTHAPI